MLSQHPSSNRRAAPPAMTVHEPGPNGAPVYRGLDLAWLGAYLDHETGSPRGTCRDELVNRAIAGEIVIERCAAAPSGLVVSHGVFWSHLRGRILDASQE